MSRILCSKTAKPTLERLIWMLSQDITGSLLELLQLSAFYHAVLYYEYSVALKCGLTADLRLHIVSFCRRGTLVELHGLLRIRRSAQPLLTRHDTGIGTALQCWPPKKLSSSAAAATIVVVGLNREDVKWAKYRSNNACVGRCRLAIYMCCVLLG